MGRWQLPGPHRERNRIGQIRLIEASTTHGLLLAEGWDVPPDGSSRYEIRGVSHRWPPGEQYAEAFEGACRQVAAHFVGRITWWEFWNEPNLLGWHTAAPGEYTSWLVRCSRGIKAGNPAAKVVLGGLDGNTDWYDRDVLAFVDGVRSAGGQPWYDAIAIHPYGQLDDPLLETADLDRLRANMGRHGDLDKPILVTEWGAWLGQDEEVLAARIADGIDKLRSGDWKLLMAAYSPQSDMRRVLTELCP